MMARVVAATTASAAVLALLLAGTSAPAAADVDLGGSPVEGTANPAAPTPLTAGLWSDTVTGPGESPANTLRFSYQRTMEYSTVLIGVTGVSAEGAGDGLGVAVTAPDGTVCDSDETSYPTPGTAFGVSVTVGPDDVDDRDSVCGRAATLDIAVDRASSDLTSDLPVAIRVVEEAPSVSAVADLLEPADAPRVALPTPGPPTTLPGVPSFDEAPEIGNGTYADEVPQGEQRLYRVRLGWGQALAARVDVPGQTSIEGSYPTVDLTLYDPVRDPVEAAVEETLSDGTYDEDGGRLFEGTPRVGLLNRFAGQAATVPGDYWVAVSVSPADPDSEEPAVDVPVELSVEVTGEEDGAPQFPEFLAGPGGSAAPDGYSLATPYLVGAGVFSADVSGTPSGADATDEAASGDDARRTAGLAVGGASLLCCAAGVVLLTRRRRVSRAAAR
ncbi:hypothetical protein FE634_20680 [Nocardioides dongxiaopingii]|uniref:hypothetical protein n=1 Tax=Nocardioides sp. S-1144 TaxID=2582905 RepID=UPI00110EBC7F|nr:hypothetical protein [Nocardioides sp. S-1144]QCW52237.1 hypothetical protein FE634_20680 [Nocardioides sp. S-1144]